MKRNILSLMVLVSLMITALAGMGNLAARSFEKAPAVTYMIKGSYEARYITGIHVFENGRVVLIDKGDGVGSRYITIPKERVERLLDFIVKEQDFLSISLEDVAAFQNSREVYKDAATTYITVSSPAGYNKLSVYNFFHDTEVSTDKMKRLREIVRELDKLLGETKKKLR